MSLRVEREGTRVRAADSGVERERLRALERGEIPIDRELDLHGLAPSEAREDIGYEVHDAHASGERCLRIIHGRGRHSPGGPVLGELAIDRLTERPLADLVLAFASAPPHQGGDGALLVLLRRQRP